MNKAIFILFCILSTCEIMAQSPIGAWELNINKGKSKLKNILIHIDNYSSFTTYDSESGEFISKTAGIWKFENNTITELIEFDSKNPESKNL